MPTTRGRLPKSNTPGSAGGARVFSFFAKRMTHDFDAFPARFSVLRPRENCRVDDARFYRPKSGIQYVPLLVPNASCISSSFPSQDDPVKYLARGQRLSWPWSEVWVRGASHHERQLSGRPSHRSHIWPEHYHTKLYHRSTRAECHRRYVY